MRISHKVSRIPYLMISELQSADGALCCRLSTRIRVLRYGRVRAARKYNKCAHKSQQVQCATFSLQLMSSALTTNGPHCSDVVALQQINSTLE